MKRIFGTVLLLIAAQICFAQTHNIYHISFENAVHHEAEVRIEFPNLEEQVLEIRMSRTSPGRYALHEFAKNVYNVRAFDGEGNELHVSRENPYQWNVSDHDGHVTFMYTLFGNRGDGTYAQIDETHAHLNMPAVFAYARELEYRPIKITFEKREDLNWEIATQLLHLEGDTYFAHDLDYFFDSPTEIADLYFRQEKIDGQTIRLAMHANTTDREVDEYFGSVLAIVAEQVEVFGELPDFDYDEYTFLACFAPTSSGDGMEHRNSTYVTGPKAEDQPLGTLRMGTISHEFIHIWNVERIRPASLEPFDYEEANMSGELWFAEGFTSYYTRLIMARAGLISTEEYVEGLDGSLNYVINSSGHKFHNPIEMSYQAPFVDAAESIDPTNFNNTFISYYSYGSVLGLALDLSLRNQERDLNLDDFMKLMWRQYGKTEIPYTIRDIHAALKEYAGETFADEFFENHIYDSKLPDYKALLSSHGVELVYEEPDEGDLRANLRYRDGYIDIASNTAPGTPLYEAGVDAEYDILKVDGKVITNSDEMESLMDTKKPGDIIDIEIRNFKGVETRSVILAQDPDLQTRLMSDMNRNHKQKLDDWLHQK